MPGSGSEYIVKELKKDIILPWGVPGQIREPYIPGKNRMMEHVIWLDGEVGLGNFYSECLWFFPPDLIDPEEIKKMEEMAKKIKPGDKIGPQPHSHPFDELFAFFGSNFDDPSDLGGEIEFVLEDQSVVFDKSCIVYIPAGLKHCPLNLNRLDKPVFHFSMGYSSTYDTKLLDGGGKYAGQKIDKYFIYDDKPNAKLPDFRSDIPKEVAHRVSFLDNTVISDATYYSEAVWFWPQSSHPMQNGQESVITKHTNLNPTVIGFFGSDFKDLRNLGAEIEVWIDGKKNIVDKSFTATIPSGVEFGPVKINKIDSPVFHFTAEFNG
jgi:mannose-6-phosphate isomerase-like protein (cupin superfamily)